MATAAADRVALEDAWRLDRHGFETSLSDIEWVERYVDAVDGDPALIVVGAHVSHRSEWPAPGTLYRLAPPERIVGVRWTTVRPGSVPAGQLVYALEPTASDGAVLGIHDGGRIRVLDPFLIALDEVERIR